MPVSSAKFHNFHDQQMRSAMATSGDPPSTSLSLSIIASAFIPFLIILIFLYHHRSRNTNKTSTTQLPPGDLGLPWIGETVEFFRASQRNRLYEDFIAPRMTKHRSSTFKTRLLGAPTVVVSGERANRFFLSNEFKLVVSSWPAASVELMGRSSIMEKQGDPHRLARGIVTSCFNAAGMEALTPAICRVVKSHLQAHWTPEGGKVTISLFRSAKMVAFRVVCECLLEMEAKEEMLGMFERVLEGVFAAKVEVPGTSFWRAKRARREIEKVVVEAVRRKRDELLELNQGEAEEEVTSLLGRLVVAMLRGEMTEEEVADNVVLFVFAAIDTTSFAMAMTFKMLAQHPRCYSLLLEEHEKILKRRGGKELKMEEVKEMKYTWKVVRETLRLHPPIFGSFRKAITDIQFDGFFIPKGWKVLWTTYGTHKSEEYFKRAEEFDPARFEEGMAPSPYVYVPFGGGPRLCAGYHLSKLNILIFVHYVVTQYEWSLLLPHEPISVNPLPFPSHGMPISISPKVPPNTSSSLL